MAIETRPESRPVPAGIRRASAAGMATGAVNPGIFDKLEGMKKPLKCLLMFHEWRLRTNDEGQQYKICDRCGAYRDFTPAAGAS